MNIFCKTCDIFIESITLEDCEEYAIDLSKSFPYFCDKHFKSFRLDCETAIKIANTGRDYTEYVKLVNAERERQKNIFLGQLETFRSEQKPKTLN